jgi:GNAT superfamily N-acetyltransferase
MRRDVGHIMLQLDGRPLGDIDLSLGGPCRRGVIEGVRVEEAYQRRGYGRVLVAAALTRSSGYSWSATKVDDSPVARSFWASVAPVSLSLGMPSWCSDMRAGGEWG